MLFRSCIPAVCVAPPSNTPGILGRRALPAGRLARLGATPDFHHGLLAVRVDLAIYDDRAQDHLQRWKLARINGRVPLAEREQEPRESPGADAGAG